MIVATYFEGDDGTEIAWKQHNVYHIALWIIVDTCNRFTRFARATLEEESKSNWGTVEDFDHRTLQRAHDFLAATWRFRNDFRQLELSLAKHSETHVPCTPESLWIFWLRDELKKWISEPDMIRYVQLILTNQNQPIGYKAEDKLGQSLLYRFSDVPWMPGWERSCETYYEEQSFEPA